MIIYVSIVVFVCVCVWCVCVRVVCVCVRACTHVFVHWLLQEMCCAHIV